MSIQFTTDSSADLTEKMKESCGVKIIPIYIHLDGEQISSDDLTTEAFFNKVNASSTFPTSAAAGPYEYYQAFKEIPKEKPIIHLSIADGVSSAYKHAQMGRDMLLEEEPKRKITIINTESATSGIILLLSKTFEKIKEGLSYDKLVEYIKDRVQYLQTIFVLESLDNLIRGGRLDRIRGAIAKTLNIKVLLHTNKEGNGIEPLENVRGRKKVTKRFIDIIGELAADTKEQTIVFSHCQALERLNDIISKVKEKYDFSKIITAEIGPVLSVYSGIDAVVMSFFSDEKRIDIES